MAKSTYAGWHRSDWNWETITEVAKLLTVDVNGNDATSPEALTPPRSFRWVTNPQWQSIQSIGTFYGGADKIYSGDAKGSYEATIPDSWKEGFQWYYDGMWGEQPFIATVRSLARLNLALATSFNSGKAAMGLTQTWYTCCLG